VMTQCVNWVLDADIRRPRSMRLACACRFHQEGSSTLEATPWGLSVVWGSTVRV